LTNNATIAVRLEGGIGDHVLGLRLLPFVRSRFPDARIILLSDAAGSTAQLEVALMSPYADEVRQLHIRPGAVRYETMGQLENLREEDLQILRNADHFFDAWGATYFLASARGLGFPVYEILATRPELRPHAGAVEQAASLLAPFQGRALVGMNLCKYGAPLLSCSARLRELLDGILADEKVTVLNLYQTDFNYGHWPGDIADTRRAVALQDREVCEQVNSWHPRIVPLTDLPLPVATAILQKCSYYVGVDNGIKHIAWALGIPLTLYSPEMPPHGEFVLRWIPDFHRLLTSTCSDWELSAQLADARRALG
jgi:hypothetical protein